MQQIKSANCFEQIQPAAHHETRAVWLSTSHLTNYQRRYVENSFRNKDELKSDISLWTPVHGCSSVGLSARAYIHQLKADMRCSLEDLSESVNGRISRENQGNLCYQLGRSMFSPRSHHTKVLKKCYLIPPCLILRIIRYVSRVKWGNLGEGVVPFSTSRCSSY